MERELNKESVEAHEDLGIAIGLEGEMKEESLKLTKQIKEKAECLFTLGDEALPHITLFQGRFPEGAKEKLEEALKELHAEDMGELTMEGSLYFRPNGNVFWNVEQNQTLRDFHEALNEKLFSLTEGLVMDQFKKVLENPDASEEDKNQIKKYGVLLAGDKFLPHVTLCRLKNPTDAELLKDIEVPKISFKPEHLILGNLGQYGEVKGY